MYPAILHDGARALQFLRYNAAKYNIDKTRFAATGGSAGGQMLMWLGFHPDLAQPDHKDPVLRESSRLQALAPRGGQTTVHYPTLLEWFGVESLNLSKREGVVQPSSEERQPTERELALSLDASPITHWTKDDPPIYMYYNGPNDTIGIIKVASGGTGISGFAKNWSFEKAQLTFDGKKGPLYRDLMNAVSEAKRISNPEFPAFPLMARVLD